MSKGVFDNPTWSSSVTSGGVATMTVHTFTASDAPSLIVRYILEIPTYAQDTVTTQLQIINSRGITIYSSALHAVTTNPPIPIDVDVFPGDVIKIVTSGDIGVGPNTVYVTLHLEG